MKCEDCKWAIEISENELHLPYEYECHYSSPSLQGINMANLSLESVRWHWPEVHADDFCSKFEAEKDD